MKTTFFDFPPDRQVALYWDAARHAVGAYAPADRLASLDLISAVNNATFKVVVEREGKLEQFALRVHRPGKTTPDALQAELRWLTALRSETDLLVPDPVPAAAGTLWATFTSEECLERFDCVLFRWLDGRFLPTADLAPEHAHEIGHFVAALHLHSERFSTTPGLTRRRLDADQFFDWPALRGLHDAAITTDAQMSIFQAVDRRVRHTLRMLGTGAAVFGLIHTDLIAQNYFFHPGGVGTVDFDDCSWGHYAYDMAATLNGFADEPRYHTLRAAYLEGYRSLRPFSEREERTLEVMMAARHLLSCCWIATHLDSPGIAQQVHTIMRYRAGVMQGLLVQISENGEIDDD